MCYWGFAYSAYFSPETMSNHFQRNIKRIIKKELILKVLKGNHVLLYLKRRV